MHLQKLTKLTTFIFRYRQRYYNNGITKLSIIFITQQKYGVFSVVPQTSKVLLAITNGKDNGAITVTITFCRAVCLLPAKKPISEYTTNLLKATNKLKFMA